MTQCPCCLSCSNRGVSSERMTQQRCCNLILFLICMNFLCPFSVIKWLHMCWCDSSTWNHSENTHRWRRVSDGLPAWTLVVSAHHRFPIGFNFSESFRPVNDTHWRSFFDCFGLVKKTFTAGSWGFRQRGYFYGHGFRFLSSDFLQFFFCKSFFCSPVHTHLGHF